MMKKVTVTVSRLIEEDGIIIRLLRPMRISRLSGSFTMDLPEGCCKPPFKIGESIQLKQSCSPIIIGENSQIIFDVEQQIWKIVLPCWYSLDYEGMISRTMKIYGFDKVEVVCT